MPAFIVSDETINKVVSYLYSEANSPVEWLEYSALKLQEIEGLYPDTPENAERLGNKLFDMNAAALDSRYGEGEAEKARPLGFSFQLNFPGSQIAAIKALESWLYQCLQGHIIYTRLYQAMKEVRNELCIDSVHQTEEYEEAD